MRQKVVAVTIKGTIAFNPRECGSAGEAEKKALAAKDALERAGVTVVDFQTTHSSIEVADVGKK
jgi:hypothetical protein